MPDFLGGDGQAGSTGKEAGRGIEDIGENTLHDSVQPRRRETKNHSGIIRKGGNHSDDGREKDGFFKRYQPGTGPDAGEV